jgi:chemotaxis protein methyltransferase CheR
VSSVTRVRTLNLLNDSQYRDIRAYLIDKTGLNLRQDKSEELLELVNSRIAASPGGFKRYMSRLRAEGEGGTELHHLVSRLTVGETHFFRNRPQMTALRDHILPELIMEKMQKDRQLKIWSAGCSTGEEPYSIAMLLRELIPDIGQWSISIMATDINEKSLATAREGIYRDWSFREVDEYYRQRYFEPREKSWLLEREIVDMVTFRYLNLADDLYPARATRTDSLDLIICRNVMIYFSVDLCLDITRRFYRCLRDGGGLLVGHVEHSDMVCPEFRRKLFGKTIVYRKEVNGPSWEKGLRPRFRGSGRPAGGLLVHEGSAFRNTKGKPRPRDTEETVIFEEAVARFRAMEIEEALAGFQRVLRINPRNERALYTVALLLANGGDVDGAEERLEKLLAVNSLHLEAIYLLSLIHRVRGEEEKEISQLKKAVYVDRNFVLGHFQMGGFYLRSGRIEEARRSLLNVLDILRGQADKDLVDGVEGLTVGGLRRSAREMLPGPLPEGYGDD